MTSTVQHLRDRFFVVTMVSNPVRFESRYTLYKQFEARMLAQGVQLYTCEIQNGARAFVVTEASNPRHLQLRTTNELWHKENALNLMIQKLPYTWEAVAWIDADIEFQRTDWIDECIQQLQIYDVIQMFQTAIDLGPEGEVMKVHSGIYYNYLNGVNPGNNYDNLGHPGFSWAATRKAVDNLGGLIDRAILGSGDRHMALSLIGKGLKGLNSKLHPNYKHMIAEWQTRAENYVRRNVGYMSGTILHHYHGQKADRQYNTRWKILTDHQYDPYSDIYTDWQGLYMLDNINNDFRDALRTYFRTRNEDHYSITRMP